MPKAGRKHPAKLGIAAARVNLVVQKQEQAAARAHESGHRPVEPCGNLFQAGKDYQVILVL